MRNETLEPAETCNVPHLHKKALEKRPENEVSMLVQIVADMGQMRTPIWILRTLLTNVNTRRGLVIDYWDESISTPYLSFSETNIMPASYASILCQHLMPAFYASILCQHMLC
jgi:hypothetical protein